MSKNTALHVISMYAQKSLHRHPYKQLLIQLNPETSTPFWVLQTLRIGYTSVLIMPPVTV